MSVFENLTLLNGISFRECTALQYVNCNRVKLISAHEFAGTNNAFVSLNSLESLQDTQITNALLDGQGGKIRFKSIRSIGRNAISSVCDYIIVDTDWVPALSPGNKISRAFVRDNLLQDFKLTEEWRDKTIFPMSDLDTLCPGHSDIWKKLDV